MGPKIEQEERIENADIANSMADSTADGNKRRDASAPFVVDDVDEYYRDPYSK